MPIMPMGLNSPLPASLGVECTKAAKILTAFIDPRQALSANKIIPPSVLTEAKEATHDGKLTAKPCQTCDFDGREGRMFGICTDGIWLGYCEIIGRAYVYFGEAKYALLTLPEWSAPSALATTGLGFGSQIGAEITDFVMILNDLAAVRTFSESGSLTLGGNVSVAAGPLGRNAEASGAASRRSVAGVFSYSQTKGLFAGISLEGSVLLERKDANKKFYGSMVTAKQLLSGSIPPPVSAEALYSILNSRAFNLRGSAYNDDIFADIPNTQGWGTERRMSDNNWEAERTPSYSDRTSGRARSSTWQENTSSYPRGDFDRDFQAYSDNAPSPSRKVLSPGGLQRASTLRPNQAIALYTFKAVEDGDLPFKKGDIITVTKRTQSTNDWWTGECNGRTGIFPSNYVQTASS